MKKQRVVKKLRLSKETLYVVQGGETDGGGVYSPNWPNPTWTCTNCTTPGATCVDNQL